MSTNHNAPECVLVFSGKRKSGKDFLAEHLLQRFQDTFGAELCCILRLSAPLKKQYALENNLSFEDLLNSSDYKETHRAKMITWGEEKRNKDSYFFCHKTVADAPHSRPIWIISDARRQTDIQYFRVYYPHVTSLVRITADIHIRHTRGFVFTPGIDDAESECGLDREDIQWDFTVANNGDTAIFDIYVDKIVSHVRSKLQCHLDKSVN